MNKQERRDFLFERAGIREFEGGMKVKEAQDEALKDYDRYLTNEREYIKMIEGM